MERSWQFEFWGASQRFICDEGQQISSRAQPGRGRLSGGIGVGPRTWTGYRLLQMVCDQRGWARKRVADERPAEEGRRGAEKNWRTGGRAGEDSWENLGEKPGGIECRPFPQVLVGSGFAHVHGLGRFLDVAALRGRLSCGCGSKSPILPKPATWLASPCYHFAGSRI